MKRILRLFPDPVLRQKARLIKRFDGRLKRLVQDLENTMRRQKHGIGIAAPQVGLSLQIAIVDVSARIPNASRLVLINPKILNAEGKTASREGCMSLPEYTANLTRFVAIEVEWQDELGGWHKKQTAGIEAICIQHEIDHLNGILFFDRAASLKTDLLPRLK